MLAEKGEPTDWSYRTLPDKNVLHGLQIGDIVRVRVAFRRGGWEKLYFQITKVDEYTKGNKKQRSVRKFCGIGLRVYIESAWDEPDIDLRVSRARVTGLLLLRRARRRARRLRFSARTLSVSTRSALQHSQPTRSHAARRGPWVEC